MYSRFPLQNSLGLRKQNGFSLIEATIILGVVGLVIGGIWVAAANVSFRYRLTRTVEQLSLISDCARRVADPAEVISNGQGFLDKAGCLPADAPYYSHMSGFAVKTALWDVIHISFAGDGEMRVYLMNPGISYDPEFNQVCRNLMVAGSAAWGRDPQNLLRITTDSGLTYSQSQFPLNLKTAVCSTYGAYFYFGIPRHQ